jgi:hypothetical protein
MERRYTFCTHHDGPELLRYTRTTLEAAGFACTVEVHYETRHQFELHTLVAVEPRKLFPVKYTRAGE